jgi:hypothetical protein
MAITVGPHSRSHLILCHLKISGMDISLLGPSTVLHQSEVLQIHQGPGWISFPITRVTTFFYNCAIPSPLVSPPSLLFLSRELLGSSLLGPFGNEVGGDSMSWVHRVEDLIKWKSQRGNLHLGHLEGSTKETLGRRSWGWRDLQRLQFYIHEQNCRHHR